MRPRLLIAAVLSLAGVLGAAGPALADTQTSSNWSGYAVHKSGLRFRDASGVWRVPRVKCTSQTPAYSAMWVGLGGFSESSGALEQTGTEADCAGYGEPLYSAWYELVPATSRTLSMRVRPGDRMRGEVKVIGRRVTITLADLTSHRRFSHTFSPSAIDTTSAEWILEAPFNCTGARCVTLPLANFGRAAFSLAHVVTSSGRAGSIVGARWRTTRIILSAGGRLFVDGGRANSPGGARPGAVSGAGSAFSLSYVGSAGQPARVTTSLVASTRLRH